MADKQKDTPNEQRAIRAFDIRTIIGTLMGIYGVILLIMGFTVNDSELDKSGGMNVNLVTGIVLLVVSAFFLTWVRLRPLLVPKGDDDASEVHVE